MPFKIAFIGDLHFGPKNYKTMNQALGLAIDVCIAEDVDCVIQLGDVFDHYNISTGQTSVATIVEAVKQPFARLECPVLIVEGNHDKPPIGHQDVYYRSSIELLKTDNIQVFAKPAIYNLPGISTLVIPWCGDAERDNLRVVQKEFVNADNDLFKLVIGHLLMEGSLNPCGLTLDGGDFFFSTKEIDSLKADLFVSGHIHRRQLAYPGIIMHHNLNDVDAPTGIRIVTIDGKTVGEDKFVELRTPRYHLFELEKSSPNAILELVKDFNDYDKYVIRIYDKPQASLNVPSNVKLEYKPPIEVTSRLDLKKEEAFRLSMLDAWKMWAERNEYSKEIIEKAVRILKEQGVV